MTSTILTTVVSAIAGGAIAAVGIIGLVSAQTAAPDTSPTSANQPVVVDYGDN